MLPIEQFRAFVDAMAGKPIEASDDALLIAWATRIIMGDNESAAATAAELIEAFGEKVDALPLIACAPMTLDLSTMLAARRVLYEVFAFTAGPDKAARNMAFRYVFAAWRKGVEQLRRDLEKGRLVEARHRDFDRRFFFVLPTAKAQAAEVVGRT